MQMAQNPASCSMQYLTICLYLFLYLIFFQIQCSSKDLVLFVFLKALRACVKCYTFYHQINVLVGLDKSGRRGDLVT